MVLSRGRGEEKKKQDALQVNPHGPDGRSSQERASAADFYLFSLPLSLAQGTPKTTARRRFPGAAKRPIRNGDGFVQKQTIAGEAPRTTETERPQVSSREWFGSFSRWLNCPFAQVREYFWEQSPSFSPPMTH